jgi:hypothetical protein
MDVGFNGQTTVGGASTLKRVVLTSFVALLIAGTGAGAYLYGLSTGEDLEAARASGAAAGKRQGTAIGTRQGYAAGFKRGRERGYDQTYAESYESAYRTAYEDAGLAVLEEISVPAQ